MANKTNCTKNGKEYYRIRRKVGKKLNNNGVWVDEFKEFYGVNRKDAEQQFEEYRTNKIAGQSNDTLYFGQLLDKYIEEVFLKDSKYTEATKERYVNAYNNNLRGTAITRVPITSIKGFDLQTAYNNLPCAPSTVRAIHNLLRLFFRYLDNENICRDITGNIVLPKVENKKGNVVNDGTVETWSEAELKTILKESKGHRLHLLLVIATNTGLRIGELLALRYDDISDGVLRANKQLVITPLFEGGKKNGQKLEIAQMKTKTSIRNIPLSKNVLEEVETHKRMLTEEMIKNGYRTEYLFTTQTGNFYDKHSLRTACNRLYKRIGVISRSFHVYRHTFGTRLAKSGVPIQTVSALMGHADINVTAKYYINVDNEDKLKAVELIGIQSM